MQDGDVVGVFVAPPRWQRAIAKLAMIDEDTSALAGVESVGLRGSHATSSLWVLLDVDTEETARRDAVLLEVWAASSPDSVAEPFQNLLESANVEAAGAEVIVTLDLRNLAEDPK